MTTTTTHRKATAPAHVKAVAGRPGVFDAIVSVFGNVDLAGERVQAGAFTRSLDTWRASGDPIPVIFSHRWDDIDAHVGIVEDVKELAPGDPMLPPELKAFGGLWARMALDVDDPNAPYAARLATLMARRSVKEFSFAFDVAADGARMASDGIVDLTDLDLFEVGPCLKGMNPDTALLALKARAVLKTALAAGLDVDQALAEAELAGLAEELDVDPEPKTREPDGAKVTARPTGSLEATLLDPLRAAVSAWAADAYGDDLYAVHLDGTFPDEGRVAVIAERWSDPIGEGPLWELNFELDDAGTVTIGAAREADAVVTLSPKDRKLAALKRLGTPARTPKAVVAPPELDPEPELDEPVEAPSVPNLTDAIVRLALDLEEL